MDDALYDEFGNYIGPEIGDSDEEEEEDEMMEEDDVDDAEAAANARLDATEGVAVDDEDDEQGMSTAVVLHEDKKYYPTAEEIYGEGVEALVMEEDAQPLEVPIIAPVKDKVFEVSDRRIRSIASPEFIASLTDTPELMRNVVIAGHLHHGKTTLVDMFVEQTHAIRGLSRDRPLRFTDTRVDEQRRLISVKMMPISLVMPSTRGKSYLLNLMDTPGHVNFNDEVSAAMRLADGLLLVVDAVEGVMVTTQRIIQQAAAEQLSLCLVVSKVDRLITELKLPPADAYFKLKHTIKEVNDEVAKYYGPDAPVLDPLEGNVAFSAAQASWSFTLTSFAKMYAEVYGPVFDTAQLAKRLWGDYYFNEDRRTFSRKPPPGGGQRTFVTFVLDPLYKIYSTIMGEHDASVKSMMEELGVPLEDTSYGMDIKPLLKEACRKIFGDAGGIVDMLIKHIPSSVKATASKVTHNYTGPLDTELAQHMKQCSPNGPLVVYACKLFPKPDCSAFDVYGRVMSGTVRPGERVRVLGEGYTPEDEEDSVLAEVTNVWLYQARYRLPLKKAGAGNLVLLEGLDATITKTATIVAPTLPEEVHIFRTLTFQTLSCVKIATEPLNPSELPKMVEGLRKINKSYPLAVTKVEESGEHTIFGTGELYLDSLMKDLRELYAEVEVKVADPVVAFCETVVETSSLKCFAETPNKRNKLTMLAEPLDKGLAEDIEQGAITLTLPRKQVAEFFSTKYEWDALAARSVWAFGPDRQGPNVLLDDCLPGEVDKKLLGAVRESIVQGFQWGSREGPLCDEPIRNVKFKLLDATIAPEPMNRGGGQIIPTARRVVYSSFLLATPRLMEPVYYVEIQTPADCITAIYNVLAKRRGHVTADQPKAGTPTFIVRANLPVVESFGFETDLRYHTQGQAFCQSVFDHWQVVPGDPLDKSIVLRPLEPAPAQALAREFMVKTRRRKGMSDDVSVSKFFDDPMLLEMARQDADLQQLV